MKKWRLLFTLILIMSLAGGVVACTPNKEHDVNKKYTITSLDFLYSDIPPKNGKGIEMINNKFNVNYKREYGIFTNYNETLATRIASGDIPDVIGFESLDGNFYRWAQQGAFLPLNDYIKDYPTLQTVPQEVWNPVTVNGNIIAIPKYFPKNYLNSPIIRKDWLDKLDLQMPTNYEELKKVAIAFTKQDPDGNGKNDTFGMVLGQELWPHYNFGAYWDYSAWYHKNRKGQYIPGVITEQRKEWLKFMADLYKEGAITKEFVLMKPTEAQKDFYSGKAGIMVGSPRGMEETYSETLQKIHPHAKLTSIPPFEAPDGSKGYTAGSGFYNATTLSAKLADDPGKVRRILDIIDFGRRFYPLEQRNSENKDFDWIYGYENKGYTLVEGNPVLTPWTEGKHPWVYMLDNKMWAPSDEANQYSKTYKNPILRGVTKDLETMHSNTKHYQNPIHQVFSETNAEKGLEILIELQNEQSKIITGDRPLSDWDQIVKQYLDSGGAQIIDEVNKEIQKKKIQPGWK
ncbi:extracellular solute-binding protein [Paenactinomyces guangxiensis]|uniref:Extracellular solute-binding protein n=1 Tax=Paenactinomyces guangxiensis TaxID=1490290 RepID=A0A7W1WUY3_9BACL|nr:extracellular solute-binding protein [Paenactinomyces guangxiensis]MBA4496453.1 extracellular solute-binding protein [Paenactinomyces guangxiensis]MBH8593569.1 extracellular solute-binding protein [Paenactinomyces guangxiensis]